MVSRRAESGRCDILSGDRDAAESGLRELAVEPGPNIDAVEGRMSLIGRSAEMMDWAVSGRPVISESWDGGQDGPGRFT